MGTVQLATRIDDEQDRIFRETTRRLGTTPADAMRVFVAAFNSHRGFPFTVRLEPEPVPFESDDEVMDFLDEVRANWGEW
ncbi:MAG: translation repressor RelB [Promicromonosporaceae bacterium]|nr:translation repressor RelB [Promicromonosporaceae bacterium]